MIIASAKPGERVYVLPNFEQALENRKQDARFEEYQDSIKPYFQTRDAVATEEKLSNGLTLNENVVELARSLCGGDGEARW
jgi:hypothetical protein